MGYLSAFGAWASDRFLSIEDQYRTEILKPVIMVNDRYVDVNMLYFQKDKIFLFSNLKREFKNI